MSEDRKVFIVWAGLLVLVLCGWVAVIGTTGAAAMWAIKHTHHDHHGRTSISENA